LSGGIWTIVATRDEQANLTHTIDGQPITARYVSAEERWAEKMKPSGQRNMTQSQRDQLARHIVDPAGALPRGSVGDYRRVAGPDGPERSIGVLNSLSPQATFEPTIEQHIQFNLIAAALAATGHRIIPVDHEPICGEQSSPRGAGAGVP
jgi:hypothetical protein